MRKRLLALAAAGIAGTIAIGTAVAQGDRGDQEHRTVRVASASSSTAPATSSGRSPHPTTTEPASTTTVAGPISAAGSSTPATAPDAPHESTTTIASKPVVFAVTPADGLPEEAFVMLSGSGFPPNHSQFNAAACSRTAIAYRDCDFLFDDWYENAWTDAEGTFINYEPLAVRRVLADGTDCSVAPGTCEVRLYAPDDLIGRVPLSFVGPPGPLRPRTYRVEPATGLVDGQQVRVTGENGRARDRSFATQCVREECEYPPRAQATIEADGTFVMYVTVNQYFVANGRTVDCLVERCWLGSSNGSKNYLSFAPP